MMLPIICEDHPNGPPTVQNETYPSPRGATSYQAHFQTQKFDPKV